MFIRTQSTPNPLSLMFCPWNSVEVGRAGFPNARADMNSLLAKALFATDGMLCSCLKFPFFFFAWSDNTMHSVLVTYYVFSVLSSSAFFILVLMLS